MKGPGATRIGPRRKSKRAMELEPTTTSLGSQLPGRRKPLHSNLIALLPVPDASCADAIGVTGCACIGRNRAYPSALVSSVEEPGGQSALTSSNLAG